MRYFMKITFLCSLFVPSWPVFAQEVIQSRGVDQQVDYESLKRFGPWLDQNYQLTRADLELLAPNEEELKDPIPAFFRVELRRQNPTLPKEGPAQYPRSALQEYLMNYKGYLINEKIYQKGTMDHGQFVVVEEEPLIPMNSDLKDNCSEGVR